MPEDNTNNSGLMDLPLASSRVLRGKQSVRATFRLSAQAITTLSAVAIHLGIKQKSLFDHLIEDMDALRQIGRELGNEHFQREDPVQKTYVLSRHTLTCLEQTAEKYQTPRDALVEYSIRRLLPIIKREREKHEIRKKMLGEVEALSGKWEKLFEKSRQLLGDEDPLTRNLLRANGTVQTSRAVVRDFIEKGSVIEAF